MDLAKAVVDKFAHNAAKYPPSKVYGSSKKYTEYSPEKVATKRVAADTADAPLPKKLAGEDNFLILHDLI